MLMERFDKEKKGVLTKADLPEGLWDRISKADANSDGSVSKDELETYFKNRRPGHAPKAPESEPGEKPTGDKPKEQKPEDAKPQAQKSDLEQPADATTASNVAVAF